MKNAEAAPRATPGEESAPGDAPLCWFVAFRDSEKLWDNSQRFIANMRSGARASQIPLLTEVMHDFLDEVLDVFVLRPTALLEMAPAARKTVDVTVATVKKSCRFLSRKILERLGNEEVRDLAGVMDGLMRTLPGPGGAPPAGHTALPISGALAWEMNRLTGELRREDPPACDHEVAHVLLELLEVAVESLYVRPLAALRVGAVARKIIHVNYLTVHKVLETAVVKLVPHLSIEQLRAASGYFQGLIVSVPERDGPGPGTSGGPGPGPAAQDGGREKGRAGDLPNRTSSGDRPPGEEVRQAAGRSRSAGCKAPDGFQPSAVGFHLHPGAPPAVPAGNAAEGRRRGAGR